MVVHAGVRLIQQTDELPVHIGNPGIGYRSKLGSDHADPFLDVPCNFQGGVFRDYVRDEAIRGGPKEQKRIVQVRCCSFAESVQEDSLIRSPHHRGTQKQKKAQ